MYVYIYIWSPPMIHPSLFVNTPVQSCVPRCVVLESESNGIYGVFCTSYITRFWFWILNLSNYLRCAI